MFWGAIRRRGVGGMKKIQGGSVVVPRGESKR